jgi:hypothetical protein
LVLWLSDLAGLWKPTETDMKTTKTDLEPTYDRRANVAGNDTGPERFRVWRIATGKLSLASATLERFRSQRVFGCQRTTPS